jgi:phospholipid/cholesterol/gamma-HCH transport system substrate-binding protein
MLTWLIRGKLAVFAALAVLVIGFTGVHYADIGKVFGYPGYYVVTVDMPQAGGLFPNAGVTYRGMSVGRVGPISLTGSGVRAQLDISNSAPHIPADTQAVVADLSAVGEQYLDLRPHGSGGPYLTAGSVIGRPATQVPPPVTDLLSAVDALANSLPRASLQTLVNELYNGFNGAGPNLQTLLADSSSFTQAAVTDITPTSALISEGRSVLATQQAETGAIEQFATDGELFAHQLAGSDADLRRLIGATPAAARQVTGLLQDNDPDLGLTIANLLTASDVTLPRQADLQELLTVLPAVAAAGNTVITRNGGSFGLSLTFFNPPPCTAGYQGTSYRNGLDTSPAPPLDTNAHCASPASSGIDVRGSHNHPAP